MFVVGLLPFSLYLFALRVSTSRHDTYTPFWINCIENAVNIVLAFPLYAWLGIPGLALAFSLAYFVGVGVALFVLQRDLHGIDGPRLAATIAKVVDRSGGGRRRHLGDLPRHRLGKHRRGDLTTGSERRRASWFTSDSCS